MSVAVPIIKNITYTANNTSINVTHYTSYNVNNIPYFHTFKIDPFNESTFFSYPPLAGSMTGNTDTNNYSFSFGLEQNKSTYNVTICNYNNNKKINNCVSRQINVSPNIPNVTATPNDGTITLNFTTTLNYGIAENYYYSCYPINSQPSAPIKISSNSVTINNLINGTAYTITLYASNLYGNSSIAKSITPSGRPSAPSNINVSPGDCSATISFNEPANNGSPIDYYYYSIDDGANWVNFTGTTITINSLTNGSLYNILLKSHNSIGESDIVSCPPVTPAGAPSKPIITNVVPGDKTVKIAFLESSDNGSSIDFYSYSIDNWVNSNTITTGLSFVITQLTNGTTYILQLRAHNSYSYSESASVNIRPIAPIITTPVPTTTAPWTTTPVPTTTAPFTTTPVPTTTAAWTTTPVPTTTAPWTTTSVPTTTVPWTTTPVPTTTAPFTTTPVPTTTMPFTTTPVPTTTAPFTTTPVPTTTAAPWSPTPDPIINKSWMNVPTPTTRIAKTVSSIQTSSPTIKAFVPQIQPPPPPPPIVNEPPPEEPKPIQTGINYADPLNIGLFVSAIVATGLGYYFS